MTLGSRARGAGSVLRTVVLSAAAVWIASQWNPFYVEEVVTADAYDIAVLSTVNIPGVEVSPELTDGVRIEQQILLDDVLDPTRSDANTSALCVDVSFVTYIRVNEGDVLVELTAGSLRELYRVSAATLEDWGRERFCLELPGGAAIPEVLVIAIEGQGAAAGQAVSTLRAGSAGITRERLVFPAAVLRDSDVGFPVPLSGPLAITTTISTATPTDIPTLHLLERFERAVMLGIPMIVAILVIVLLVLDERRSGPPSRQEAPSVARARRRLEGAAAARRADLRAIGTALVVAGLLVLTLGTSPAADDRVPIPLGRTDLGVAGGRVIDTPEGDGQIEQFIAPSRLPDRNVFARDPLGRQEDVCLSIAVQQPEIDGDDPDTELPNGSLVVALELLRDPGRNIGSSDVVDVTDAEDGRVLACFDVNASQLARASNIVLRVTPDADDPASLTALRLQQLRSDEERVRVTGPDGPSVADGALDYLFVREARSYREIVLLRIGSGALLLGAAILVALSPRARRSTRRGTTSDAATVALSWQQDSRPV